MNTEQLVLSQNTVYSTMSNTDTELYILHINHNLDDIFRFNQILSTFAKIYFICIPYGNTVVPNKYIQGNNITIYHMRSLCNQRMICRNSSTVTNSTMSFATDVEKMIEFAIGDILLYAGDNSKIIIIEDGGYHYEIMRKIESRIKGKIMVLGCIEQTRAGLRRCMSYLYDNNKLSYPVLSVARSLVKTRIESYYIARRTVEIINEMLYELQMDLSFRDVTILGYGILGRNVAKVLSGFKCNSISVIESDEFVGSFVETDGYTLLSSSLLAFSHDRIIIGTTGRSAFSIEMLRTFIVSSSQNLILASVSSRRDEFADVLNYFSEVHNDVTYDVSSIDNVGTVYSINCPHGDKSIVLLADGYPVNFYINNKRSLTDEMIDIVYTEIILLINVLCNRYNELTNSIHLLGADECLDTIINESAIAKEWIEKKNSEFLCTGNVWELFDCHPAEIYLRKKTLERDEIADND